MNRSRVLKGAQRAFFEAMLAGYANDGTTPAVSVTKTRTPDGYKNVEVVIGDYRVVDRYNSHPYPTVSDGTTQIFFQDKLVWQMFYNGTYSERAILFLKSTLGFMYRLRAFRGGRGPRFTTSGQLFYKNDVEINEFSCFKGREEIHETETKELLGSHDYWGHSTI